MRYTDLVLPAPPPIRLLRRMNTWIWLVLLATALIAGNFATAPAASPRRASTIPAPLVAGLGDTLTEILRAGIRDSAFPGAVAVVGTKDSVLLSVAAGQLDWQPSPATSMTTLWDMASLTKVVALTSSMMLLTEGGQVDLDAPVQRYVPEFTGRGKEAVTVRHLLTHSSGLPA